MSSKKYTIKDYAMSLLQNFLGNEPWDPSPQLVHTLLDNLNLQERQNRFCVRREIKKLGERCAIGHENKLILLMGGQDPYVLTNKDKEKFLAHFSSWWNNFSDGCISSFVESWATFNFVYHIPNNMD